MAQSHLEVDREGDELGVLLHEVLDAALLEELQLVLLQVQDDARAALERAFDLPVA